MTAERENDIVLSWFTKPINLYEEETNKKNNKIDSSIIGIRDDVCYVCMWQQS